MSEVQKIFAEYEAKLDAKELALIDQKKTVLDFVVEPHSSDETKKHLRQVHLAEASLIEVIRTLTEFRISSEFKEQAEKLCGRCKDLNGYTRDMDKILTDDLQEQNRAEDKKSSVDIVRNAGILAGIVGFFIAAQKAGVGNNAVDVNQAAEIGATVGVLTLMHKSVRKGFTEAAKAVCSVPKKIKNSFTLYYVRETIKQQGKDLTQRVQNGAHNVAGLISPKRKKAIAAKVAETQRKEL